MDKFIIYYDYSWPFVYNATVWLQEVKNIKNDQLIFEWRHFQLEEAKMEDSSIFEIESKDLSKTRSLLSAVCAESAKLQGQNLFERFHYAVLNARNNMSPRFPLNDFNKFLDLAVDVGLDRNKFIDDFNNPQLIINVKKDHQEGVKKYGVFGTPTLVFDNEQAVFIKTFIPKDKDDYIIFFEYIVKIFRDMPFIGELKRPQPPWPKGIKK